MYIPVMGFVWTYVHPGSYCGLCGPMYIPVRNGGLCGPMYIRVRNGVCVDQSSVVLLSVLSIIVCHFVLFFLTIVFSTGVKLMTVTSQDGGRGIGQESFLSIKLFL